MPKETFPDARGAWAWHEEGRWLEPPFIAGDGSEMPPGTVEHKVDIALDVHWGVESIVQLGVINRATPNDGPAHGWVVELDRPSINRLINVLRKARDQAYGADQ